MEGVTEIPDKTFMRCYNVKRVICANTVVRIEWWAFFGCKSLAYIQLSITLEFIGDSAFVGCDLSSVFIPPRCRDINFGAFAFNTNLSIFYLPHDTELPQSIIHNTALAKASPFQVETIGWHMNEWIKNINNDEAFALHRACSSFQPLKEVIHAIVLEKGLKALREENSTGITPSKYLKENPYTELSEKEIIHDYLMKMMGEVE
ncbi:hypothetical protein CTEN210_00264 [Chaetoceros tenuissimus]|uniref:Leucine-rich repeat domain-containing protein n=1 Tax=Chaetoceros tenuissimus TaxID=426638 RepID=A0AAD3CFE3_9STRA|nr:hypothetical protein CTEN210_00264 [Chaetoceros tenuissimus]